MKFKIIFLIALLKLKRFGYIDFVRCKIIELVLADYQSLAHTVRSGLFLCVISLCIRIFMVKLERDTFECAGTLTNQSANPFQLCHPYLAVNGRASKLSLGAYSS